MELFTLDARVADMERALGPEGAQEPLTRLPLIAELAWQLRQRDCRQALLWVDQADALLDDWPSRQQPGFSERQQALCRARLLLVRAEVDFMYIRHEASEQAVQAALALFSRWDDPTGEGDCHWLMASIWIDRGDTVRRDESLLATLACYQIAGDQDRIDCLQARRLFFETFRDVKAAAVSLAERFPPGCSLGMAANAWLSSAQAVIGGYTVELAESVRHFSQAYRLAQETGQIRLAVIVAGNCAESFATLGDLDASLEWNEKSLDLARPNAWPVSLGFSLTQTGNTLRLLGRHAEAKAALVEALQVMQPLPTYNGYLLALGYAAEVCLDLGEVDDALAHLQQFETAMASDDAPVAQLRCLHTQARALVRKRQAQAAHAKASQALELARAHGVLDDQIKVLRVFASLYLNFPDTFAVPDGMTEPSPVLHFLAQALTLAGGIQGYTVSGELLDEMATAYAEHGDFRSAYDFGHRASAARATQRMVDARNRAVGLALREESIRSQAQIAHHQHVAQAEAKRAELLHEASVTLETLGQIGREITGSLDTETIFKALHHHAQALLDVTSFYIYLLTDDGRTLTGAFAVERDTDLQLRDVPVDSQSAYSARCAREGEEIVVDLSQGEGAIKPIPGSLPTLSLLFSPLKAGARLLGVISIQSSRSQAYGERERSISRTLCSYAAIAIDNSKAYAAAERSHRQAQQALQELRQAQSQLVQAEKMASLGGLVAGVAHELNTPLGNGLVAVTALGDKLAAFQQGMASGGLKRQAFDTFLLDVGMAVQLAQDSLQRSAKLVASFKQLAVDQGAWPRGECTPALVFDAALRELWPALLDRGIQVEIEAPEERRFISYPSALSAVLARLLENALAHGFAGREGGRVQLRCEVLDGGACRLTVRDDGCGIAAEHLAKVFDPFFTTRMGQSSGLGLYSANNLVTQVLGGTLSVSSVPGEGTEFVLELPS